MTKPDGSSTSRFSAGDSRSEVELRVNELVGSCAEFVPMQSGDAPRAIREIALLITASLIETEVHVEPQGCGPWTISRHPDHPVILARRVLAALHVLGELERSSEASLLAGLVARHLLLSGDHDVALDFSVLALDLSSRTGGTLLGPILGVLAASLSRCGHAREATQVTEVLADRRSGPSDWRDIHVWAAGLPSDGRAEASEGHSAEDCASGVLPGSIPRSAQERSEAVWADEEWLQRIERFGLHRHRHLHRLSLLEATLLVCELEDEAIQSEWQVG